MPPTSASTLNRLRNIDGRHPLQAAVPSAIVPYPARRRRDSELAFFNFELAREIGLIPLNHPDRLDAALRRTLLETFSLVIVNEWDEMHGRHVPSGDRRPHTYMATRYLQLQHPDKRGLNSGDGRSIWNGILRGRRGKWDVSSCGTGVTRLCPATSAEGRFFKTGNSISDYGCGTAHIDEGIGAALTSEVFARNGIRTERVLAVLALPSGQAINVRVAPNLLRPSHFFGLLRRGEDEALARCVDYYAQREIDDGRWPALRGRAARARHLAEQVAVDFARATATFEHEYIFCWLDWDGDNILTDGSIIDYGSVRQFGLYHRNYRFEDTDRYSTSIPEQRRKARQIVQRFIQIRELLVSGKRKSLASLRRDPVLKRFDQEFDRHRRMLFVRQLGASESEAETWADRPPSALTELMRLHTNLERRRSSRGPHRVPDGLSWNAIYCMRDVLRELPERMLVGEGSSAAATETDSKPSDARPAAPIPATDFLSLALSAYASRADRRATPYRRRIAGQYQRAYLQCVERLARQRGQTPRAVLADLARHSASRNPAARATGDGLDHATRRLTRSRRRLAPEETYRLIRAFAQSQNRGISSSQQPSQAMRPERPLVRRIFEDLQQIALEFRESL